MADASASSVGEDSVGGRCPRGSKRARKSAVVVGAVALAVAAIAPTAAAAAGQPAPSRTVATSHRHGSARNPQGPVKPIKRTRGAHAQIVADGQITTTEVYDRAMYWVNQNLPYGSPDANAPSDPLGPYRVDCSGFISM